MKNLLEINEWQALFQHQKEISTHRMRDWFANDPARFSRFSLAKDEIFFDYSRNLIHEKTLKLLCDLANRLNIQNKIEGLFSGDCVNSTEQRPALHHAFRNKKNIPIVVNGKNIMREIHNTQKKMSDFVDQIHHEHWRGSTGKPIQHIVNVGIGGSHLGPKMCTQALADFANSSLNFHFVSSIDRSGLVDVFKKIDPETTLFIVSSKTFSTLETLTNAKTITQWMQKNLGKNIMQQHFVAVTSASEKALDFGIPESNIFPIWDWVGGRYSIWSAIGLPLMLMIGNSQFSEFLEGAYQMDEHFKKTDFEKNIPVLMALISIWYLNFFNASVQAIIPYSLRLRELVNYLQQADMESNGKSTNKIGAALEYTTGPVIFGEEGCNGQHAYHQLLLQGKHFIPVDFILTAQSSALDENEEDLHQDLLIASGLSQAQALMRGKTLDEAYHELLTSHYSKEAASRLAPHRVIPGNKPSNILLLRRLTPKNLGALLALYEHKIFVQGAIWDINSFDQWGVELGKQLLPSILRAIRGSEPKDALDPATQALIHFFKQHKTTHA